MISTLKKNWDENTAFYPLVKSYPAASTPGLGYSVKDCLQ